jgi:hypothetical protein
MKFSLLRFPSLAKRIGWQVPLYTAVFSIAALTASSQNSSPTSSPAPAQEQSPQHHGTVIFSRSTDENGQVTTTVGPGANPPAPNAAAAPIATDAEREAVTITAYDLDVHLEPAHQAIAVRARLTVRNDGPAPLAHIPLQISSSLNWERIRIDARDNGARDAAFQTATLNSDADHTGQLHEAAVTLAAPLAPGATLALDVTYSGVIAPTGRRLVAIGAPDNVALHSDWDQIGVDFTGLRGFGNVVWYPVASVPAILGISQAASTLAWQPAGAARVDSARLFDEIGQLKLRSQSTQFRMHLACEFPPGRAPTVAFINGRQMPLAVTNGTGELPGVATATFAQQALGFIAPSLFVAIRQPARATNATLWTLPDDASAAPSWSAAATAVTPLLENWLGPHPRSPLAVLDLPDPADASFETGALLAAPVQNQDDAHLDTVLVHALAHAWLAAPAQPPPAWLDEGVATFLGTLWLEKEQGRTRALESLEADRQALALAEPASPGVSAGQPLTQAYAPIYFRTKAAYIFWMLRDLAGDAALQGALRAYASAGDKDPAGRGEFEKLVESNSGRDLGWFFLDWVDADKGLPDIAIDHVASAPAQGGETLVAVDLSNAGYAAAEIPVTVSSAGTSVTQRVLIPAQGKVVRRILIQGAPTAVQANDGTVPETQASLHITNLNFLDSGASPSPQ